MFRSKGCDFLPLRPKLGTLDNSAVPRGSNRIWDRGMATTKEKQDFYVPYPAQNPSPNSRLGDIGYLDHTGTWRRVVNLLDSTSCDQLGNKPLRSMQGLASEYITERRQREPIVNLYSDDTRVQKFPDWEYIMPARKYIMPAREYMEALLFSYIQKFCLTVKGNSYV
jgi:hypothetical protein